METVIEPVLEKAYLPFNYKEASFHVQDCFDAVIHTVPLYTFKKEDGLYKFKTYVPPYLPNGFSSFLFCQAGVKAEKIKWNFQSKTFDYKGSFSSENLVRINPKEWNMEIYFNSVKPMVVETVLELIGITQHGYDLSTVIDDTMRDRVMKMIWDDAIKNNGGIVTH